MKELTLIATMSKNRVIGLDNQIPWSTIPNDKRRFVRATKGKPIVMGRLTFESLPNGALHKRTNIVVSGNGFQAPEGVIVVSSLEDALSKGYEFGDEVMITGGEQIYNQTIDLATKIMLTTLHVNLTDDKDYKYFPFFNKSKYLKTNHQNKGLYTFSTYELDQG